MKQVIMCQNETVIMQMSHIEAYINLFQIEPIH